MTTKDLLERALKFDAGPPVHCGGFLLKEGTKLAMHHHYTIQARFSSLDEPKRWAIMIGTGMVMSKSLDDFDYELPPSSRTKKYLKDTRFETLEEAFKFLEGWRKREQKRIKKRNMKFWPYKEMM